MNVRFSSFLFLLILPAFGVEVSGLMKPGDEMNFPGFNLRWTNQGSPRQVSVEEYLVSQKFGLDQFLLRRREVRAYDGKGFMVSRLVYGGEGAIEGMETNTADAQGFASESLRLRGLSEVQYKWVYARTNAPLPGLILSEVRYQADGSIHSRNVYQYDGSGQETNRLSYDFTGFLEYRQAQTWGSNQELLSRMLFRGTGTVVEKYGWAYSNRLAVSESLYNMEGDVVRRVRWAYTNARFPNLKSDEFIYGGAGELRERSLFYYDASGRLSEQKRFDGASGFRARATNAYDPQGRKMEEVWYKDAVNPDWKFEYLRDGRGNPVELRRLVYRPRFGEASWDLSHAVKISYNY